MPSYNFDAISLSLRNMLTQKDEKVRTASEADMSDYNNLIEFQRASSDWSMSVNLYSTTIKTLSDALTGVVQKM